MAEQQNRNDADAGKGAVEGDGRGSTEREQNCNTSLAGQNPHRTESRLVKSNDSDFPEPGGSPEHSGQGFTTDQHGGPHQQTGAAQRGSTLSHEPPGAMKENTRKAMNSSERNEPGESAGGNQRSQQSPDREEVNQDPGERQKENQSGEKDDPLAA